MEKVITITDPEVTIREYAITTCTAIAVSVGDTERQDALLVESEYDGEKFQQVVFGYPMPETEEDFLAMCEDSYAWDFTGEDLATVQI